MNLENDIKRQKRNFRAVAFDNNIFFVLSWEGGEGGGEGCASQKKT